MKTVEEIRAERKAYAEAVLKMEKALAEYGAKRKKWERGDVDSLTDEEVRKFAAEDEEIMRAADEIRPSGEERPGAFSLAVVILLVLALLAGPVALALSALF